MSYTLDKALQSGLYSRLLKQLATDIWHDTDLLPIKATRTASELLLTSLNNYHGLSEDALKGDAKASAQEAIKGVGFSDETGLIMPLLAGYTVAVSINLT